MDSFLAILYKWYEKNRRNLPWRVTSDPYNIWISEIILQQTRVNQGVEYYHRFLESFPDVKSLAIADEHEVLKKWQGLGYYSRARNLHQAAKTIVSEYGGIFPDDFNKIISLTGIGSYTASAIASIAFNQPSPVLDGNVFRFLSRYFNIHEPIDSANGKKYFGSLAENLLDRSNPGLFNQAIMEFGALQCIPDHPVCSGCVLHDSCLAYKNDSVMQLPVKTKKIKIRDRFFNYLLFEKKSSVFLQKRTDNDIWRNLYQLPLLETLNEINPEELLKRSEFTNLFDNHPATFLQVSKPYKHNLTHQRINSRFYHFRVPEEFILSGNSTEVLKKDISKFAVPRLIEIYLTDKGLII